MAVGPQKEVEKLLVIIVCFISITDALSTTKDTPALSSNSTVLSKSDGTVPEKQELSEGIQRTASLDEAESGPWVRVYNRPPGTIEENSFNYETRGNTSAHTSGDSWSSTPSQQTTTNKKQRKDILRVTKETAQQIPQEKTDAPNQEKSSPDSNVQGVTIEKHPFGPLEDWSGKVPEDGTSWKVVGEGGEEGWQVLDNKGSVEWKIEYDDGEWRVTSANEEWPEDGQPEYIWDVSVSGENDYDQWQSNQESLNPAWGSSDPSVYQPPNDSRPVVKVITRADDLGEAQATGVESATGWTNTQRRTTDEQKDVKDIQRTKNKPADRNIQNSKKTKNSESLDINPKAEGGSSRQQSDWFQEYDNQFWGQQGAEWNADFEPWGRKDPPSTGQWNAQTIGKKPEDLPKKSYETVKISNETNTKPKDNPIKEIVWKTGYDGTPWSPDNLTWKFPDPTANLNNENQPQVWSQYDLNRDPQIITVAGSPWKNDKPEIQVQQKTVFQVPFPGVSNRPKQFVSKRRTGEESWEDNTGGAGIVWSAPKWNEGGGILSTPVIGGLKIVSPPPDFQWKKNSSDGQPTATPYVNSNWQYGGWKVISAGQKEVSRNVDIPYNKRNSDLVNVNWKREGDRGQDPPPKDIENQNRIWAPRGAPWFGQGGFPGALLSSGCKITIQCGSNDGDVSDESNGSPEEQGGVANPPEQGKAWPPTGVKSWKPPPPTPGWVREPPAPPKKGWKAPPPPPQFKKSRPYPPPGWKSKPRPPVAGPWKKPGPPPSKTWKFPPTKSWKGIPSKSWRPPMQKQPDKSWQSPIATPMPDSWEPPTTVKPECKESSESSDPPEEDVSDDEGGDGPQIIIITKLPGNTPVKNPEPDSVPDISGNFKAGQKPWKYSFDRNRRIKSVKNVAIGESSKDPKRNARPPKDPQWYKRPIKSKPFFGWPNNLRRWPMPSKSPARESMPLKYKNQKSLRRLWAKWLYGQ